MISWNWRFDVSIILVQIEEVATSTTTQWGLLLPWMLRSWASIYILFRWSPRPHSTRARPASPEHIQGSNGSTYSVCHVAPCDKWSMKFFIHTSHRIRVETCLLWVLNIFTNGKLTRHNLSETDAIAEDMKWLNTCGKCPVSFGAWGRLTVASARQFPYPNDLHHVSYM